VAPARTWKSLHAWVRPSAVPRSTCSACWLQREGAARAIRVRGHVNVGGCLEPMACRCGCWCFHGCCSCCCCCCCCEASAAEKAPTPMVASTPRSLPFGASTDLSNAARLNRTAAFSRWMLDCGKGRGARYGRPNDRRRKAAGYSSRRRTRPATAASARQPKGRGWTGGAGGAPCPHLRRLLGRAEGVGPGEGQLDVAAFAADREARLNVCQTLVVPGSRESGWGGVGWGGAGWGG
jgi:hypothetical protein